MSGHRPPWCWVAWVGRRKSQAPTQAVMCLYGEWTYGREMAEGEREAEWFMWGGKSWIWREKVGEDLGWCVCSACHQSHADVWAHAAAEGRIWVCGAITVRVCVNVHGSSYHWRLCRCLGSQIWDHVGVQEPSCCWVHTDLIDLCFHQGLWWLSRP